jgi:four helix bundle protein
MMVYEKYVGYENPIVKKSFDFAVRILKFFVYYNKKGHSLEAIFKQILRSGTSIGANISEAQSSPSKKDFINKLTIALKEAKETEYWLNLLITENEFSSLNSDCKEIIKILVSIIKTSEENL